MRRTRHLFIGFCALCCLMLSTQIAYAQLNLANGYASGQWYNPARDGEGFYVEVIGAGENLAFAVAMYSYDAEGSQLWLVGTVPIEDGDSGATVPVIRVEGPVWGTAYDPADAVTTEFGNIVVQFPTCDSALFSVNSNVQGLESGNYSLVRLTEIVGMDCVEPTPPDVPPPGPAPEVTPGLWTGDGVCFFVNAEGTKIEDSDQCDNGKSFSARVDGVEVPTNNYPPCNANVLCNGAWPIVDQTYFKQATCINADGGIGVITFAEDPVGEVAFIKVVEAIGLDLGGKVCAAGGSGNIIARPPQ